MNPKVGAVVLAYNNYEDTRECLISLLEVDYTPLSIWLVDNGSYDDTAQRVTKDFPSVHLVRTGRNLGVAGGFNLGIIFALRSGVDYIFLLNNDTVVEPDVVRILSSTANDHPEYGILMPKILYYDNRNRIWSIGARYRRFPPAIVMLGLNKPDAPPYTKPRLLDYAPTCALFIPSKVFKSVGLLDDGYFFYYDDWDYSIRVRQAGYKIAYIPHARVYHKVSRTIQREGRPPNFWYIWGYSGGRFYRHHGRPALFSAFVHLGYLVLREGLRNGPVAMWHFVRGAIDGYRQLLSPYPFPKLEE